MERITVVLADDQALIRDGLVALLAAYPDIQVMAAAGDGKAACDAVRVHRPDVVLMDIRMPLLDGVEATRQIKREFPDTVVIILTTFADDDYILQAMTGGASGYLLKDIRSEQLVQAIRDGKSGSIILPGRIAARISAHVTGQTNQPENPDAADPFTERERDIIRLLVQGQTNQEIAATLYLSLGTVKNYVSQIYLKTGINDRTKVILHLKQLGF